MKIWVSGSLAYDVILDYRGRFADHINPDKVHVISLSFLVSSVKKSAGGTAGNIAYSLAMLGVKPELVASVGEDGREILGRLKKSGVSVGRVKISKQPTAAGYAMTDSADNQIWGFHPGAMSERAIMPPAKFADVAIIAAENPNNMASLAAHYAKRHIKYIFDPGQSITVLSKQQLQTCIRGASIVIGNDYEIDYIFKKIKQNPSSVVIRTLGAKGSEIIFPNGKIVKIRAAKAKAVDPTGAGDAYRAGLIAGMVRGLDIKTAAQLGATSAAFAVEQAGTQNHRFNYGIIENRRRKNFNNK